MRRLHINWTHLIRQTAIGVFILQFVHWFQHYWLSVTTDLVYAVLAVVFALQLLLVRAPIWLRLLLQAVGVAVTLLIVVEWIPIAIVWQSWEWAFQGIWMFAEQFFPYAWFGLAVWMIYLILNESLQSREQVFLATILGVVIMAIADSYTSIYLWEETAMVVVSGLILMVNRHFAEFREKHPSTWKYIAEYPWGITLTAGLLVGFIVVMGNISPNVRPLVVDPYTAWNQLQGRSVNFSAKEDTQTAIASFRSSLLSTSGYGRDDSELGGGFNYNYDPVFQVTSKVRSYWRGESKSVYTGSGWISPTEHHDFETYQAGLEFTPDIPLASDIPMNEFTQYVRMIDEDDPPKLFAAYPVKRIDAVNGTEEYDERFLKNKQTGAIETAQSDTSIRSYTVTSAVPVISEELLNQATHPELDQELLQYTLLPDTVPQRVYDLVEQITADAETPYEKAKAIETYLRMNYAYTNTPDLSRGSSDDFVDRFLFEMMEGYCDYFSTAMAVMVRTLDLPARWVKGYTSGVMDEESMMMLEQHWFTAGSSTPEMEVTYTVRNSDAHSWVEVYFEGYGWVMFEPTTGFTAPVFTAPSESAIENLEFVFDETFEESPEVVGETNSRSIVIVLSGIILLAMISLVVWLLARQQAGRRLGKLRKFMEKLGLMRAPANPNEQIVAEFNRLLRILRRKGLMRAEHQTVREAIATWAVRHPSMEAQLSELLHGFELAKYSARAISEQEAEQYQMKLRELRQQVKKIA